jgi:acyl-CoA thioesterase I
VGVHNVPKNEREPPFNPNWYFFLMPRRPNVPLFIAIAIGLLTVGQATAQSISQPANQLPDDAPVVLCIGDSNGENKDGWVRQLSLEWPRAQLINKCKSGNTIGFDNNGNEGLNELKNIDRHLAEAATQANGAAIRYVVVGLGTNDTKANFANQQEAVAPNLERLLRAIRNSPLPALKASQIVLLSPPPIATPDNLSASNAQKFAGATIRMQALQPQLAAVAKKQAAVFVNTNEVLGLNWAAYSYDGIHLTALGARLVAQQLSHALTAPPPASK